MATKNLQYESGRSMVEMLGTLAIIGVLSIGGITGYSYGMDKYRANQTVNDIMLRAVDLIAQATQGQEALTLSEWQNDSSVYDISGEDYTKDNLIVFDVGTTKPLPETVCKMVYDALKTQAFQIDVNAERADSHELCGNDNTMTFYFDYGSFSPDGCKNDSDCGDGRYCDTDTGFCFWGGEPEVTNRLCDTSDSCCTFSGNPYDKHGDDCSTATIANGMCYYGTCIAKGCTYDENKCTGKAEYCASPNDSCEEAFPNGKTGTCVKEDFTKLDVAGKTYYVSHNFMTWWDADAACKALGRDGLVGVSDLINGWNGGDDPNSHEFTDLGKALRSHLGSDYWVWTSDDYDSCNAFVVNLYAAYYVNHDYRNNIHANYPAVCQ